jgi:hypothetical protein
MSQSQRWPSREVQIDSSVVPDVVRLELSGTAKARRLDRLEVADYILHTSPEGQPVRAVITYGIPDRRNFYVQSDRLAIHVTLTARMLGNAYPTAFVIFEMESVPSDDDAIFEPPLIRPGEAAAILDDLVRALAGLSTNDDMC